MKTLTTPPPPPPRRPLPPPGVTTRIDPGNVIKGKATSENRDNGNKLEEREDTRIATRRAMKVRNEHGTLDTTDRVTEGVAL